MSTSAAPETIASDELPDDGTTSPEIVRRASITEHTVSIMPLLTDEQIRSTWRTAKALAASRMFKDAVQAEQAFAKILIGRDLGISPTQALMAIDLVKGAIQLRGVLLASFVQKHPDYEYVVLAKEHNRANVRFVGNPRSRLSRGETTLEKPTAPDAEAGDVLRWKGRYWEVLGDEEFTIEDAARAKLVKTDSAWQAHPKNMCFWRAISNGVKTHAPELLGGMPVYVEGELERAQPYSAAAASQEQQAQGTALPDELEGLVARANAIDPRTWRHAEVAARLPEQGAEGYQGALDGLVAELNAWLAEHDPPEAEVVDGEPVDEDAPAGNERVDVTAALQKRWEEDSDWRALVGPLLGQYADLSIALDAAVGENDEEAAEQLRGELAGVEEALDGLGCPAGWVPESDGQ